MPLSTSSKRTPEPLATRPMLKAVMDAIRNKMQTTPAKNKTLIDTRKMSAGKKAKIKTEATKPEVKGRKPRSKNKTK